MAGEFDSGACVKLIQPQTAYVTNDPKALRFPGELDRAVAETLRRLSLGVEPWPLFLWGEAGSGKTCAALTLLDCWSGLYYTTRRLADDISAAIQGTLQWSTGYAKTRTDIGRQVIESQIVVLDEIGDRDKASEHEVTCVKRMLDLRQGKPLVCMSNRSLEDLGEMYGDPIASRMGCGTTIEVSGDRRDPASKPARVPSNVEMERVAV